MYDKISYAESKYNNGSLNLEIFNMDMILFLQNIYDLNFNFLYSQGNQYMICSQFAQAVSIFHSFVYIVDFLQSKPVPLQADLFFVIFQFLNPIKVLRCVLHDMTSFANTVIVVQCVKSSHMVKIWLFWVLAPLKKL